MENYELEESLEEREDQIQNEKNSSLQEDPEKDSKNRRVKVKDQLESTSAVGENVHEYFHHDGEKEEMASYKKTNEHISERLLDQAVPDENHPSSFFFVDNAGEGRSESAVTDMGLKTSPQPQKSTVLDVMRCADSGKCFQVEDTLDVVDGIRATASKTRGLALLPAIEESIDEDVWTGDPPSSSSASSITSSPSFSSCGNVLHHHASVHKVSSKPTLTSISEELVFKTERDSLTKGLLDNCKEKTVGTSNQSSSAMNVIPHSVGLCLNQGHGDSGTTKVDTKTLDTSGDTEIGVGNNVPTLRACVKAAGEAVIVEEDKDKITAIQGFESDNVLPTNKDKTIEEIKLTQNLDQSDKLRVVPFRDNESSCEYFGFKQLNEQQGLPLASMAKTTLHSSVDTIYPTESEQGGRVRSQTDGNVTFLTNNQTDSGQCVPMLCVGEEQVVVMTELIKELGPPTRSTDLVTDEACLKCISEQRDSGSCGVKQMEISGEVSHDSLQREKWPETMGQEEKESLTNPNGLKISEGEKSETLLLCLGEEQMVPLIEFMKERSTDLGPESSRLEQQYQETASLLQCSSSVQQNEDHIHCDISEPPLSAGSERFRPKSSGSESLLANAEDYSASGISEPRESFSEHTRITGGNERQEKDNKDKDALKQRDKEALKCRDREKSSKHTEREDTVGTHGDGGTNLRSVIENVMNSQTEGTAVLSELRGTYVKAPCRLESQTAALNENEMAWNQRQQYTQRRLMNPIFSHLGREDVTAVSKKLAPAGESIRVSSSYRLGKRTSHPRGSKWKASETTCADIVTDPDNLCRYFLDSPVTEKSDTTTKDSNVTENETSLSTQSDPQNGFDSHQLYTLPDLKNGDVPRNNSPTCISSVFHSNNSESWANPNPISVHNESSNHPATQTMGGNSSLSADVLSPSSIRDDNSTEHSCGERHAKLPNHDENHPVASSPSPQSILIPSKVEKAVFVSSSSEGEHYNAVSHSKKDDEAFFIPSASRKENLSRSLTTTQENHGEREDVSRPVPSCATDKDSPGDSFCLESEQILNMARETNKSCEVCQKEDMAKLKNSLVSGDNIKELNKQEDQDFESNEEILSVLSGLESALEQDQNDDIFCVNNLEPVNRIEPEKSISQERVKFAFGQSQEDPNEARANVSDFSFSLTDSENVSSVLKYVAETERPDTEVYESGSLMDVAANVMLDSDHFSGADVQTYTTSSSSESAHRNTTTSLSTDLDTYTATLPSVETETDEISEDYKSSEITSKSERSSGEEIVMSDTDATFSRCVLKRIGRPGNITDDQRNHDSKQPLICAGSHQSTALTIPGRITDRYPGPQVMGSRNISASLSPGETDIQSVFCQSGGLTVGQRQENSSYVRTTLKNSPRIDARACQERAPGPSESGCGEWIVDSAKIKDSAEFSIYEEAKMIHLESGIHCLDPELGGSGNIPKVGLEKADTNLDKSFLEMHDQESLKHSDVQDEDIKCISAKPFQRMTTEYLQVTNADSLNEVCSAVQNKSEPSARRASQSLNTDSTRVSRKDAILFGTEQEIHEEQTGQVIVKRVWKDEKYKVFEESVASQQIRTEVRAPEIINGIQLKVQEKLENDEVTVHETDPGLRKSQELLAGGETKMLEMAEHSKNTTREILTKEALDTRTIVPQTHVEVVCKSKHLQDPFLPQESCLPIADMAVKQQNLETESLSLKNDTCFVKEKIDGVSSRRKVVASSERPRSSGSFTMENQENTIVLAPTRQYPLRVSQKSPLHFESVRRIQIVDVHKYPSDKPSIYRPEMVAIPSFQDASKEVEKEEEGPTVFSSGKRKKSLWKRVKGRLRPFTFGFSQGRVTLRRKPAVPEGKIGGASDGQLVPSPGRVKLKPEAAVQSVDVGMLKGGIRQGEEAVPSPSASRTRPTLLPSQPLEETSTQYVTAWHRPQEADQHARLRNKASMQRDQWRRFRRLRTLRHGAEERGSLPAMRKHHVTKKNYIRDSGRHEKVEESGRKPAKDSRKIKSNSRHRRHDASLELLSDNVITCRASNSSHKAAPEVFEIFCDNDPKESKHDSLRKEEATVRFLMATTTKSSSAHGTQHCDGREQNSINKTESVHSSETIVPTITCSKRKLCSLM